MALPIITAVRQRRDLKESVLHTCIELAHRSSIYGVVPPTAYSYLAKKAHCSARTAIRHIHTLEALRIIEPLRQKRIVRRHDLPPSDRRYSNDPRRAHDRVMVNEVNRYRFCIIWDKSSQHSSSSEHPYDTMSRKLPPQGGREKEASLEGEIRNQEKTLRDLTPGSGLYLRIQEEIVRLRALQGGH